MIRENSNTLIPVDDWLLPLLKCLKCGGNQHEIQADGILCLACGKINSSKNGVTTFFAERVHPILQKELAAIRKLDESASLEDLNALHELLLKLDSPNAEASEEDKTKYSCIQHLMDSRKQIEDVLASHPIPSNSLVLEIGADHCYISNLFLDRNCQVIGLDISDHLELATRKDNPKLRRIKADMNRLPLEDQTCDVIWSTSAAHHSWDLKTTFQEAHRVLKPGGSLFFCCEPIPSLLRYPFGKDFGEHERTLGINECWISRSRWLRACEEAGFEQVELMFPNMEPDDVRKRLRERNIPQSFAGLLRPFLKMLQVSIHLKARKP